MTDTPVEQAIRETTRLLNQARATKRALRRLQDSQPSGRLLGTYTLAAGEEITGEVLDLLRLAVSSTQQEVVISITALTGTDREQATDEGLQR